MAITHPAVSDLGGLDLREPVGPPVVLLREYEDMAGSPLTPGLPSPVGELLSGLKEWPQQPLWNGNWWKSGLHQADLSSVLYLMEHSVKTSSLTPGLQRTEWDDQVILGQSWFLGQSLSSNSAGAHHGLKMKNRAMKLVSLLWKAPWEALQSPYHTDIHYDNESWRNYWRR